MDFCARFLKINLYVFKEVHATRFKEHGPYFNKASTYFGGHMLTLGSYRTGIQTLRRICIVQIFYLFDYRMKK